MREVRIVTKHRRISSMTCYQFGNNFLCHLRVAEFFSLWEKHNLFSLLSGKYLFFFSPHILWGICVPPLVSECNHHNMGAISQYRGTYPAVARQGVMIQEGRFNGDMRKKPSTVWPGETLDQVVQRSCGCSVVRNAQSQAGQGFGQPSLGGDIPAHSRGRRADDF